MLTSFNWIDLVIILLLIFFALDALGRSFFLELLDLVSFLLAFFLSFRYYNFPANFFESQFKVPHGLSLVLGFMSIWFLSEVVFYLLLRIFLPKLPKVFFSSKYLSMVPAVLRGLLFTALILVMIATFPIQPVLKKAVLESQLGSVILKNAYNLEAPVKNVFGGVASESLTFLTIEPKTNEKVDLGFQTTKFSIDAVSEQKMIELVNQERTSRGFKALVFDERLRTIARMHSEDMFTRGYFSHYSPDGLTVADRAAKANIDFSVIGENLAFAPDVGSAHKGLMNSPGHRANILSADFGKIGIGVADGGIYGRMFTQVFTN